MPLLCVQWETPDDWQRNCPKHVEFYSKNKSEELVHLVGFIIRIYHDARSPERQARQILFVKRGLNFVKQKKKAKCSNSLHWVVSWAAQLQQIYWIGHPGKYIVFCRHDSCKPYINTDHYPIIIQHYIAYTVFPTSDVHRPCHFNPNTYRKSRPTNTAWPSA